MWQNDNEFSLKFSKIILHKFVLRFSEFKVINSLTSTYILLWLCSFSSWKKGSSSNYLCDESEDTFNINLAITSSYNTHWTALCTRNFGRTQSIEKSTKQMWFLPSEDNNLTGDLTLNKQQVIWLLRYLLLLCTQVMFVFQLTQKRTMVSCKVLVFWLDFDAFQKNFNKTEKNQNVYPDILNYFWMNLCWIWKITKVPPPKHQCKLF